ncbi:MAG: endo-1,4-beta-xylanase [Acidobacteriota bacterium]|nr:endo-1,4-beta-xylanase [Acidobacteriota bacterium]
MRKLLRRSAAVGAILMATGTLFAQPFLRKEFAGDFLIGAALSKDQILDKEELLPFVAAQFSAVTAENAMKWEKLNPARGRYEFEVADRLAAFARENDIHLTGHTLVWHSQTPGWVFEDESGRPASRELLLSRLEKHINTVVGRYRGTVPSWDVVNEALNEDGTLRESPWYKIIGEEFLEKSFEFAHRADPAAELYYNDYNLFKPAKREGAIRLVKRLQEKGIPIHGVGMQAHYSLDFPADVDEVEQSVKAFAAVGVKVLFTELDVSVLPFPNDAEQGADIGRTSVIRSGLDPYVNGLPLEIERRQSEIYQRLFRIFLRHRASISRVTFWGVNDGNSWKNNWPIRGRTDYPLLFDRKNRPKKALLEIVKMRHEQDW